MALQLTPAVLREWPLLMNLATTALFLAYVLLIFQR